MNYIESKIYSLTGVNSKDAPIIITENELSYLLEQGLVEIRAKKIRGSILGELGKFYDDGMGGISGHSGKSAAYLKEQKNNDKTR
jgi:hypothetical protein